jgi:hypothetical protein
MDGTAITNFLAILAQGLLIIALPIVIAAAFQYIRKVSADLKSKIGTEQWETIQNGVKLAVRAAEQVGLSGQLKTGREKLDYAISAVQDHLNRAGVPIEIDEIVTLIEAEVNSQFSSYAPPVDTAEARSALLDKAVETAVLAAEQTGLKTMAVETAANVALAKKQYAVELAEKYLDEHGIDVDAALIDGMIEAQIMKLKLKALEWKSGAVK